MKWILVPLLFFAVGNNLAQTKHPKAFSDSTFSVGIYNFYQSEDLYTFAFLQINATKNLLVDAGIGAGWRAGLGSGSSLAGQVSSHYNLSKSRRLFFGPSIRYFHDFLFGSNGTHRFSRYGGELGYLVSYGHKWKVIQSSYCGLHGLTYNTVGGANNRLFFGYSFQLGVGYEF